MKKKLAVFLLCCFVVGLGLCGFSLGMSSAEPSATLESPTKEEDIIEVPEEEPEIEPEPENVPTEEEAPYENLPSEDEIFQKFTEEHWKNISIGEIEKICEELAVLMRHDLALEFSVEVDIINDTNVSWIGCHYGAKSLIEINLYQLYEYCSFYNEEVHVYIVDVLAHEHRHAYQKQRVNQGFDTKLEDSYKNYIRPEENYEAYYNQLCEVDARNYGEYWENLLQIWLAA